MAFVLIAQQPLDFKGQHYEPGDRLIAEWYESAPLQRRKLTILAPSDEQRAHGQSLSATIGERLQGQDVTPRRRYHRRDNERPEE